LIPSLIIVSLLLWLIYLAGTSKAAEVGKHIVRRSAVSLGLWSEVYLTHTRTRPMHLATRSDRYLRAWMPRSYARRCEIHRGFIGNSSAWVRLRTGSAVQRRFHLPFPWACSPGGRGSLKAVYRLRPSPWCLPDPGRPDSGQPAGRRADRSQHHSGATRHGSVPPRRHHARRVVVR
jgi:hypothetical protein